MTDGRTFGEAESYSAFIADCRRIEASDDPTATPFTKQSVKLVRVAVQRVERWRQEAVQSGLDDEQCCTAIKRLGCLLILMGNSATLKTREDIAFFTELSREDLNKTITAMAAWFQPEHNA